ncbi:ornithine cyclodeaminase family protein [Mangrovicoccus sp. HB161399]|uniref:ornithine cyclodeaminase family protein n=1 Tax=Mangrovicoccus sp. HB161399 TaxID=2720392 RepID=UPI0015528E57|nr:ornithine cyclodeaminase family protein [Mangrovicoccus sp. HB161399]
MEFLDHDDLSERLDWGALIGALAEVLGRGAVEAPPRHVHQMKMPDGTEASLLLMPAWEGGRAAGVKVVTFFPGNAGKGLPTINAGYLMFDGATGQMRAVLEGDALTSRRTAAASALAARYLAREDAQRLLVVGTGQLAMGVAEAHSAVRPYDDISIWGRSPEKAAAIAAALAENGLPAKVCTDLEAGVRAAGTVSCVTASTVPLVLGEWLSEGSHLDLIGAFKADMRESDTAAISQASLFVDGRPGALLAGDLAQPIAEGAFGEDHIRADLPELIRGTHPGRTSPAERTVFKSVGLSAEDLAAAVLALGS